MKKGLFLFILLTFSCFLYAQETNELVLPPELPADLPVSIKESDDYKLAQRYREMAIDAHSVGDYNQSIEYSRQSKEYSDKLYMKSLLQILILLIACLKHLLTAQIILTLCLSIINQLKNQN